MQLMRQINLRYEALTNNDLYEGEGELRVRISADKEKGTVTISDNGIGMTRDGVIETPRYDCQVRHR